MPTRSLSGARALRFERDSPIQLSTRRLAAHRGVPARSALRSLAGSNEGPATPHGHGSVTQAEQTRDPLRVPARSARALIRRAVVPCCTAVASGSFSYRSAASCRRGYSIISARALQKARACTAAISATLRAPASYAAAGRSPPPRRFAARHGRGQDASAKIGTRNRSQLGTGPEAARASASVVC